MKRLLFLALILISVSCGRDREECRDEDCGTCPEIPSPRPCLEHEDLWEETTASCEMQDGRCQYVMRTAKCPSPQCSPDDCGDEPDLPSNSSCKIGQNSWYNIRCEYDIELEECKWRVLPENCPCTPAECGPRPNCSGGSIVATCERNRNNSCVWIPRSNCTNSSNPSPSPDPCAKNPPCSLFCPFGKVFDAQGCALCQCNETLPISNTNVPTPNTNTSSNTTGSNNSTSSNNTTRTNNTSCSLIECGVPPLPIPRKCPGPDNSTIEVPPNVTCLRVNKTCEWFITVSPCPNNATKSSNNIPCSLIECGVPPLPTPRTCPGPDNSTIEVPPDVSCLRVNKICEWFIMDSPCPSATNSSNNSSSNREEAISQPCGRYPCACKINECGGRPKFPPYPRWCPDGHLRTADYRCQRSRIDHECYWQTHYSECKGCSPRQCGPRPKVPPVRCPDGSVAKVKETCEKQYGVCNWNIEFEKCPPCRDCSHRCRPRDCGPAPTVPRPPRCRDGSYPHVNVTCTSIKGKCDWSVNISKCPVNCGPVCKIYCPYGNEVDKRGCPICKCKPRPACNPQECPPVVCPAGTTPRIPKGSCCPVPTPIPPPPCYNVTSCPVLKCPPGKVQGSLPGACCPQCVDSPTCSNNSSSKNTTECHSPSYDCKAGFQLVKKACDCFVCEPLLNCSNITCITPRCPRGSKKIVDSTSCCPYCIQVPYNCSKNCKDVKCGKNEVKVKPDLACCPFCVPKDVCDEVRCPHLNCDRTQWVKRRGECCYSCRQCKDKRTRTYDDNRQDDQNLNTEDTPCNTVCDQNDDPQCPAGYWKGKGCWDKIPDNDRENSSVSIKMCVDLKKGETCQAYSDPQYLRLLIAQNYSKCDPKYVTCDIRKNATETKNQCCVEYVIHLAKEKSDTSLNIRERTTELQRALRSSPGFTVNSNQNQIETEGGNTSTSTASAEESIISLVLSFSILVLTLWD